MCLGQHGHVLPLLRIVVELLDEFLDHRAVDLFQGLLDREGYAGVVDVLRGQSEMDELLVLVEASKPVEFLLDEIFHGLHVVVGGLLDFLDACGVCFREVAVDVAERVEAAVVEVLQLRQRQLAERDEVFNLHAHPVTDEGILREIFCQQPGLVPVSPVDRRDGGQCV